MALLAAVVAVVWANSPWGASYDDLRATMIGPLDVEHWAADGALTLFFFVAGWSSSGSSPSARCVDRPTPRCRSWRRCAGSPYRP